MRKIKFRWKDKQGKTFYSTFDFEYGALGLWTSPSYHGEIDRESVVQLVGYDKNGNEVYEGDILVNDAGAEFIASISFYAKHINTGAQVPNVEALRLKE